MSLAAFFKSLPLWMALAFGQLSYGFSQQTDARGTAFVVVSSDVAGSIRVEVRGDDGTVVNKTVSVKAGQDKKVTWVQKKPGSVHYTAHVESGDNSADFEFDCARPFAASRVRLTPKSSRGDLVDRHQITYETSFPITRYEFSVYDPAGDMSDSKKESSANIAAGERFTVKWDSYDEVFLVELKAFGPNGENASDRRVPWSLEIPHTEVNFDSGKAIIKSSEEPKVDAVWAILAHELDKLDRANIAVNADLSAQLYIVGYTDTVGNPRDNQVLSKDRARAIAEYFRTKGVWCEIYFAGMGERGLSVETGDSVDEVRNRRALYLLSPQTPPGGGSIPSPGAWTQLSGASKRLVQTLPPLPESYIAYKEKQREARRKKFGGESADATSDSPPAGGGPATRSDGATSRGGDERGSSRASSTQTAGAFGDGDGAPPKLEPSSRGCSVTSPREGGLGWLALLGLVFRRRRRSHR